MNNSNYLHNEKNGCDVIDKYFTIPRGDRTTDGVIRGAFCLIHQKTICRCGFEWGWHYGTNSDSLLPFKFKHSLKIKS